MSPTVISQSVRLRQESSSSTTTTRRMTPPTTNGDRSSLQQQQQQQQNSQSGNYSSSSFVASSAEGGTKNGNSSSFNKKKRKSTAAEDNNNHKNEDTSNAPPMTFSSSSSTTKVVSSSKRKEKKKSRSSPFRVKVGCVVAIRYRPTGNRVTLVSPSSSSSSTTDQPSMVAAIPPPSTSSTTTNDDSMPSSTTSTIFYRSSLNFSDVWIDPQPGRDDGLSLIGKRVRCCFPSSLLSQEFQNGKKPTTRLLEGEVISIIDYPTQIIKQKHHLQQYRTTTTRTRKNISTTTTTEQQEQSTSTSSSSSSCGYGIRVELLIEQDRLTALPFLKRIDPVVDITQLSDTAKRGHINEERIRGKNKAIVEVILADSSGIILSKTKEKEKEIVARWVLRKRVPATLPLPTLPPPVPPGPVATTTTTTTTTIKENETTTTTTDKTNNKSSNHQKLDDSATTDNNNNNKDKKKTNKGNGVATENSQGEKTINSATTTTTTRDETQNSTNHNTTTAEQQKQQQQQPVPPPKKKRRKGPNGPKDVSSAARYVGDGNDPIEQQEKNWRWEAGRYNTASLFLERPIPLDYLEMLSHGLMVGEVIQVQPAPATTTTNSSSTSSTNTLAWVTIKRLLLPEHTQSGRMPHHNLLDLFEDYDSTRKVYRGHYLFPEKNTSGGSAVVESGSGTSSAATTASDDLPVYFQFPIEELVIVSRKVKRNVDPSFSWSPSPNMVMDSESLVFEPIISASYRLASNQYYPLVTTSNGTLLNGNTNCTNEGYQESKALKHLCHRCRILVNKVVTKKGRLNTSLDWCKPCMRALKRVRASREVNEDEKEDHEKNAYTKNGHSNQPEWKYFCDCDECQDSATSCLHTELLQAVSQKSGLNTKQRRLLLEEGSESVEDGGTAFLSTRVMLRTTMSRQSVDFGLPPSFLTRAIPYSKPITKVKAKSPKRVKRNSSTKHLSNGSAMDKTSTTTNDSNKTSRGRGKSGVATNGSANGSKPATNKETPVFQPTSCRLLPYNSLKRKFDASALELYPWTNGDEEVKGRDKPRDLRLLSEDHVGGSDTPATEKEIKTMNSRAARANQRRLMRDVAAIGLSLDTLSGREQQLRFDRSGIHAWGVFADDDLREGEMLIEYRGEIIGNAMAEKREKEYEAAKIGSDYMFRIDDFVVCDATKQGNVARFINASCDPNCYTKIISIDGSKRIAIYAKRDISAGEELCYDYKFPLEYDESKRIPCHCHSRDCRGFMNWDKKYVALPDESDTEGGNENTKPASTNDGESVKRFKHASATNGKEG